ncbi:uncharacterized protein si:ch211-188c18.1 isoform X2 [Cyprinodon tularosa]|uniref:uncharacterized protein si:ch211-188c18.1 isoform X2 n=1 Tax=Cyprinodon tularosa TaxID=77115 RepID=UPI0018E20D6A|nr:uncharacterized protein si:ch211-188c18.1 isoform X2 [Cyprinodon tularosa]
MYTKLSDAYTEVYEKGQGSILLVVAGNKPHKDDVRGQPNLNMTVVFIVIAVGVLLIIMLVVICRTMQKTKSSDITVEQTCVATSTKVYEDKECVKAEDEAEDDSLSLQHANPTETSDTLDHSVKRDAR